MPAETLARREFLAGSGVAGATVLLPKGLAAADRKKTLTILHTNDLHSYFIGMAPSLDYTRETEKVEVVICLSHGGVIKGKDGRLTEGDDVHLAKAVQGIDVVIGGHSHTALQEAIIVNGRMPVVQAGKYGEYLGELAITLDGGKLTVASLPDRRHHCGRPGD